MPTVFDYLTKIKFKKDGLKNVKYVVSGGDMVSMSSKEKINDFLKAHGSKALIENGYGLTEASGGFIFSPLSVAEDPDGIGYPLPDNDVIIMDINTKKEIHERAKNIEITDSINITDDSEYIDYFL